MNRRQFNLSTLSGAAVLLVPGVALARSNHAVVHYDAGSMISGEVAVMDAQGQTHKLLQIIQKQNKKFSVVFIFGGGSMGSEHATGGIWCPDSFEDLHILRTLSDNYGDAVGFVPIACPPVFHSRKLGYADRAFLDYAPESEQYKDALAAFIDSTQRAFEQGIIPTQPYYDPRFRLLMSSRVQQSLAGDYGEIPDWQGAFRAVGETQSYGVPNFWLLGKQGRVLTKPFRGNVYHPHGGKLVINYSLADMMAAIDRQLA